MAIQTLDMKEIRSNKVNIYEMCLVIAARARGINAKRIAEKREIEMLDDMDMYDETDIYDRELMSDIKFEKEINPTVIAQDEFLEGKIRAVYPVIEEKDFDE